MESTRDRLHESGLMKPRHIRQTDDVRAVGVSDSASDSISLPSVTTRIARPLATTEKHGKQLLRSLGKRECINTNQLKI
jgi:hypothetical protein